MQIDLYLDAFQELVLPQTTVLVGNHSTLWRWLLPDWDAERNPSARDIAGIISQIRSAKIPAVFLENVSDDRLIRRIAAETGSKVGGTLISDGLTGEKGPAPTYIDMVRHNIKALTSALSP